ncbi:MAG: methyltransferase domain-containing protein [Kiritimatiellae bacterium]|nr:methyltransferase domain-containing protein [Kiritimatiellia bacterium]
MTNQSAAAAPAHGSPCAPGVGPCESTFGDLRKIPGHWLFATMGKRVLRPGGLELTRAMLSTLNIQTSDEVVEFAPGLGVTARMILRRQPARYTAIERSEKAVEEVKAYLSGPTQQCLLGSAEETGLPSASATVVYGEAMLTMQTPERKRQIIAEAFRLLKAGGRYGIHELSLTPDDLSEEKKEEVKSDISCSIHVGARPLTANEWRVLLADAGFEVQFQRVAPMHLLEPRRLVSDEGFFRALRFVFNVLRAPIVRKRVLSMRRAFRKHRQHLAAITLVAVKPQRA